jgi:2-desacetyl-2-hydroxyethyl bacteriochlorophyllide A dehydrogenase
MDRLALYFSSPRQVEVVREELPAPGEGQLLVRSLLSAISPGTESLIYRDQFPSDLAVDENLNSLAGEFQYPLKYGYCLVGKVAGVGTGAGQEWLGKLVFSFQPHVSSFLAFADDLIPLPPSISPEEAIFLPNMETAVNLVMDGAPLLGERAAVFGQGIVGLLTTALLARFPLERLVALDLHPNRRQAALEAGATDSYDPTAPEVWEQLEAALPGGADLVYEVSGAPQALNQSIALAGFSGRVVIGSWYGQKRVELDLGGRFHRSRIQLIASQVSSLAPVLSGRWTKARRFGIAWEMLDRIKPSRWITHRYPVDKAQQAYRLMDERPADCIQIVFEYPEPEV